MKPIAMPDTDSDRVFRGGSCHVSVQYSRVASRGRGPPIFRTSSLGFRSYCRIR